MREREQFNDAVTIFHAEGEMAALHPNPDGTLTFSCEVLRDALDAARALAAALDDEHGIVA